MEALPTLKAVGRKRYQAMPADLAEERPKRAYQPIASVSEIDPQGSDDGN
jgi:hypothetical protein